MNQRWKQRILACLSLLLLPASVVHGQQTPLDARQLAQKAAEAMGGAERLRAIQSVRVKAISYENHLEQSERPEGPWIIGYIQATETRDFQRGRLRNEGQSRSFFTQSANWFPSQWVFAGGVAATIGREGRMTARDALTAQQAEEALELGPERVILTALAAGDLHREPDVKFHGYAHAVVSFTWKGNPVRVLLSPDNFLPAAVELTRPRPESFFWGVWGDVTFRASFSLWMLEKNGVRLPRTVLTEWSGFPVRSATIDEIEFNVATPDADFAIPDDVKQAFAARRRAIDDLPLGRPDTPPQEIAPGITQIRGAWDVGIVRQADGIVILDGVISNGYTAKVIADAQQRYAGLPVKAVVTTSDAWPHIGGMREYVAREIPVYALDWNRPILERLLGAPHKMLADALARAPKPARITWVSKRITIGSGSNRFELIPLRTVIGERQMAVWFPEHKLLYASDLFQRDRQGNFFVPQTVSEIVDVARREGLDVKSVFAMHLPPTAWEEVLAALAQHTTP